MTELEATDTNHVLRIFEKGTVHELPIELIFRSGFGGPALAFLANVRGEIIQAPVTPEHEVMTGADGAKTLYYSLLGKQMISAFVRPETALPNRTA